MKPISPVVSYGSRETNGTGTQEITLGPLQRSAKAGDGHFSLPTVTSAGPGVIEQHLEDRPPTFIGPLEEHTGTSAICCAELVWKGTNLKNFGGAEMLSRIGGSTDAQVVLLLVNQGFTRCAPFGARAAFGPLGGKGECNVDARYPSLAVLRLDGNSAARRIRCHFGE